MHKREADSPLSRLPREAPFPELAGGLPFAGTVEGREEGDPWTCLFPKLRNLSTLHRKRLGA